MKTTLKSTFGALSLALLCGTALAQGKGETVRFQEYPGTGNVPLKVAKAKGLCDKHGFMCESVIIPSGALGSQALAAGSIEVALIPIETQAAAIAKGADFIGIVGGTGTNGGVLIANNKVDLPNRAKGYPAVLRDLKGKKFGVSARGTFGEIATHLMLRDAGLTPEDVTFVAVGGVNTALPAMLNAQIDAQFTIEPLGAYCDVTRQCRVLWRHTENDRPAALVANRGASNPLTVRRAWAKQNPHLVDAIRAAFVEADKFTQNPANFDELMKIVKAGVKLELPQADEILTRTIQITLPYYRSTIDRAAAARASKVAVQLKMADREVTVEELIDSKAP